MKKVIFMGKTRSGKTTLCQNIDELEMKYKKTQSVELYNNSIDTPGEYMENRNLYSALMVTSADADVIALVYDPTQDENYIAPGFASMFCKDVIGIITKVNKIENKEEIELAVETLTMAGVSEIFKVDTIDGLGVTELLAYLNQI